jgi:hypothetical protein
MRHTQRLSFAVVLFGFFCGSVLLLCEKETDAADALRPVKDIVAEWRKADARLTPLVTECRDNKDEYYAKKDAVLADLVPVKEESIHEYPVAAAFMDKGDVLLKTQFNSRDLLIIRNGNTEDHFIRAVYISGKDGYKQLDIPGDKDFGAPWEIDVLRLGRNMPTMLQVEWYAQGSGWRGKLFVPGEDGVLKEIASIGGWYGRVSYADIDNDGIAEVINFSRSSAPESLRAKLLKAGYDYYECESQIGSIYRYDVFKWKNNKLNKEGYFYDDPPKGF